MAPDKRGQPPFSVLRVTLTDGRGGRPRAPGLAPWLARVAPAKATGEVTIALVSDARIRTLNREFRRKDAVTDVLSFPAGPSSPAGRTRGTWGTS